MFLRNDVGADFRLELCRQTRRGHMWLALQEGMEETMNRTLFAVALVALILPTSYAHARPATISSKGLASDGGTVSPDAGGKPDSCKNGATLWGAVFAFDGRNLPPGANLKLVSSDSGDQRVSQLKNGEYKFCDVHPGKYELKAEAVDLRTAKQAEIEINDSETLNLDVVLERDEGPEARVTDNEGDRQAEGQQTQQAEHSWLAALKSGWMSTCDGRAERRWGLVALVILLLGTFTTRWYKIAKPSHNFLMEHRKSVKLQVETHVDGPHPEVATKLKEALEEIEEPTGLWRFLFWSQSAENASWVALHDIEAELAAWLPPKLVRTHLIIAEPQVREIGSDSAKALADEVKNKLDGSDEELQRMLLSQAKAMIWDKRDQRFIALTDWQNKASWLALIGSILIVVLGAVEGNSILFIAGAAGGLLSRMGRALSKPEFAIDHGASWGTLFLSPLFGALSAWFGVGLITALASSKVQALGPLFSLVRWGHPLLLSTLTAAFLLGFSERYFDSLVRAAEGTVPDANTGTAAKRSSGSATNGNAGTQLKPRLPEEQPAAAGPTAGSTPPQPGAPSPVAAPTPPPPSPPEAGPST